MLRPLRRPQLVADLLVAGVFALIAYAAEQVGRTGPAAALGSLLIVVGMAAALAVRRLSPALALAGAWAAGLVQMSLGRTPSTVDLAIFGVLYASAAYGTRRIFWAGFSSAIAGAAVGTAYLFYGPYQAVGDGRINTTVAVFAAALLALLLSWTVGALVRTAVRARENRLAQEWAEAEASVEVERVRIARDMHDVVAHSLAVVVAQADGARYAAGTDPEATSRALETIGSTARSALADVRLLLIQLRHSESEGPQPQLTDLEALYTQVRAAGVDLRVAVEPVPVTTPPAAVQLAVYRILQEALTNALRHGDGGTVRVDQHWLADRVDLLVRNTPAPFRDEGALVSHRRKPGAPAVPSTESGHGLLGMRERAQLVGGRCDAGLDGDCFVVRVSIPIGTP